MERAEQELDYLDLQALIGISKHNGGQEATDALLDMCHVAGPQRVLYVGSGVGVGPTYIARRRGARVVGVDIHPGMVRWSRERVQRDGLVSRVELGVSDVAALPFESGSFDAVVLESVLAFVSDKAAAIDECVRVTKPGGHVGANESCWLMPPPLAIEHMVTEWGTAIPVCDDWPRIWTASDLEETALDFRYIDAAREVVGRVAWMGVPWVMEAWGRLFKLALERPEVRSAVKEQIAPARYMAGAMGYYLMAGRKPAA
jgi:SAM-dependent methyltransferase